MDVYEYMQRSHRWALSALEEEEPARVRPYRWRQRDVRLEPGGKPGMLMADVQRECGLGWRMWEEWSEEAVPEGLRVSENE